MIGNTQLIPHIIVLLGQDGGASHRKPTEFYRNILQQELYITA